MKIITEHETKYNVGQAIVWLDTVNHKVCTGTIRSCVPALEIIKAEGSDDVETKLVSCGYTLEEDQIKVIRDGDKLFATKEDLLASM